MKKRKNNESNKLQSTIVYYLVIVALFGFQTGCNRTDCKIVEFYDNGSPKIEECLMNKQKEHYSYNKFYPNGNVETRFEMVDGKLEGEVIEYYLSGNPKSKKIYINGKKNGDGFTFLEDKSLEYYYYFAEDQAIYIKNYDYDLDTVQVSEGFIPIIKFEQDTINKNSGILEFDLSFPLPDSLLKGRPLVYAFEMKPLSQKDSLILLPSNEIILDNQKTMRCSLKLTTPETQIFYGHTFDKEARHIFQPFEKVITVLEDENM